MLFKFKEYENNCVENNYIYSNVSCCFLYVFCKDQIRGARFASQRKLKVRRSDILVCPSRKIIKNCRLEDLYTVLL